MNTATTLIMFAAFAQAGLVPMLPSLEVRYPLHNSTIDALDNCNSTKVSHEPTRRYDTAGWRVYIAFLVLGILVALLTLPVVCSPDLMRWYRSIRGRRNVEERTVDVEFATAKMQEMAQPDDVYLPRERVH